MIKLQKYWQLCLILTCVIQIFIETGLIGRSQSLPIHIIAIRIIQILLYPDRNLEFTSARIKQSCLYSYFSFFGSHIGFMRISIFPARQIFMVLLVCLCGGFLKMHCGKMISVAYKIVPYETLVLHIIRDHFQAVANMHW